MKNCTQIQKCSSPNDTLRNPASDLTGMICNPLILARMFSVWDEGELSKAYHVKRNSPRRFLVLHSHSIKRNPYSLDWDVVNQRICPGMHFAETALFSVMVSTLALTNIVKAVDPESGEELFVEGKMSGTLVK